MTEPPGAVGTSGAVPAWLTERETGLDVLVPDGAPLALSLARTTVLGVGAHPDDLEIGCLPWIAPCRDDPDRWFTGVVLADGAGSAVAGPHAGLAGSELVARRRQEQRNAARIGRYGLAVQLGRPSGELRDPGGRAEVVDRLHQLLDATEPEVVVTHAPVDRHPTHLATCLVVVDACRALPPDRRPHRLLGVEGWRGLDWLARADEVRLDVSGHAGLAARLLGAHESQLGAKRYVAAGEGRRRANATLDDPWVADEAEEVVLAVDLTALLLDDALTVEGFVDGLLARFADEARTALADLGDLAAPPPA